MLHGGCCGLARTGPPILPVLVDDRISTVQRLQLRRGTIICFRVLCCTPLGFVVGDQPLQLPHFSFFFITFGWKARSTIRWRGEKVSYTASVVSVSKEKSNLPLLHDLLDDRRSSCQGSQLRHYQLIHCHKLLFVAVPLTLHLLKI